MFDDFYQAYLKLLLFENGEMGWVLITNVNWMTFHPTPCVPVLQSGYWGRGAMDPEPTRCRRTDGKKWRCSRDVVAGQKYCERHVHRGRNRSRKPVEVTTTTTSAGGGGGGGTLAATTSSLVTVASSLGSGSSGGTHFALSGSSPSIDLLQLNRR